MTFFSIRFAAALFATAGLLAGCATGNPFAHPDSSDTRNVKPNATPPAHSQLTSGIDAYNGGDYASAIKRLNAASDPTRNDRGTQLEAIKYLAFSYCVIGQTAQCKLQFERALRIDPSFDLAPGEKGHPLWGPVFDRAKKGR